MAKKYRFKLLQKEVAEINKILDENNITFSFDELQNYLNAIHQIAPVMHKSYDRYLKFIDSKNNIQSIKDLEEKIKLDKFNRSCLIKSSEYEVGDDIQLVTTGYGYQYRFVDCCPRNNVVNCSDIITSLFNEIGISDGIFDLLSEYGLMYSGDGSDKLYEGLYLWINQSILDRRNLEEKRFIFNSLFIDDRHIDFLCGTDSNIRLNYIGFNKNNLIVKYAVKFPREEFFLANPEFHYKDYFKLTDVVLFMQESVQDTDVAIQFVPGKSESIAIESEVSKDNYSTEIRRLISNNIISESQGEKLLNMNMEKCHHTMIKYKWDSKDSLQVKVYLIEDLLTT